MREMFERTNFPRSLENIFETEYARYVGRAYDLKHLGHYVTGNASLSRHPKNRFSLHPEFKVKTDPSPLINPFFICFGESQLSEPYGYRSALAAPLAKRGIDIPDGVLDGAFGAIDSKLMEVYRQIYPLECVVGTVIDAFDIELVNRLDGKGLGEFVTLFTIEDPYKFYYHVGLKGIQYALEVGSTVKVTFDRYNVIAGHVSHFSPVILFTPFPEPSNITHPLRVASFYRLVDY